MTIDHINETNTHIYKIETWIDTQLKRGQLLIFFNPNYSSGKIENSYYFGYKVGS